MAEAVLRLGPIPVRDAEYRGRFARGGGRAFGTLDAKIDRHSGQGGIIRDGGDLHPAIKHAGFAADHCVFKHRHDSACRRYRHFARHQFGRNQRDLAAGFGRAKPEPQPRRPAYAGIRHPDEFFQRPQPGFRPGFSRHRADFPRRGRNQGRFSGFRCGH